MIFLLRVHFIHKITYISYAMWAPHILFTYLSLFHSKIKKRNLRVGYFRNQYTVFIFNLVVLQDLIICFQKNKK